MSDNLYTILLAAPSPTLAPLYYAYVSRKYSGAFKDVRLAYPADEGSGEDPLMHQMLSTDPKYSHIIAAIGDPFRALHVMDDVQRPLVICGLIQHMFYWTIGDKIQTYRAPDNTCWNGDENSKLPLYFEQLIIQPKYMSGYAIAGHHLSKNLGMRDPAVLDAFVYTNTVPGYERSYYRHFQALAHALGWKRPYAYMTADPRHGLILPKGARIIKDYAKDPEYQDRLMTAVVVGEAVFRGDDHVQAKMMGIRDALANAIGDIYRDPEMVAVALKQYSDPFISFDARHLSHTTLLRMLRHFVDHNAYPPGAQITCRQIERGAKLRESVYESNPHKSLIINPRDISKYVLNAVEQNTVTLEPRSKIAEEVAEVVAKYYSTGRSSGSGGRHLLGPLLILMLLLAELATLNVRTTDGRVFCSILSAISISLCAIYIYLGRHRVLHASELSALILGIAGAYLISGYSWLGYSVAQLWTAIHTDSLYSSAGWTALLACGAAILDCFSPRSSSLGHDSKFSDNISRCLRSMRVHLRIKTHWPPRRRIV